MQSFVTMLNFYRTLLKGYIENDDRLRTKQTICKRIWTYMSNTTGVRHGTGSEYHSGSPKIIFDFWWGSWYVGVRLLFCVLYTLVRMLVVFFFFGMTFSVRFFLTLLISILVSFASFSHLITVKDHTITGKGLI